MNFVFGDCRFRYLYLGEFDIDYEWFISFDFDGLVMCFIVIGFNYKSMFVGWNVFVEGSSFCYFFVDRDCCFGYIGVDLDDFCEGDQVRF